MSMKAPAKIKFTVTYASGRKETIIVDQRLADKTRADLQKLTASGQVTDFRWCWSVEHRKAAA